ncbi:hypothetical protein SAMN05428970_3097 [Agromyces sp. CF514]|uniref:hypothetical protein n=1 Tax=Agromyces sp. CF514 TaxID=1881031 RepID=UPI0008F10F2C|nr:hypothetical protein [Agromyces sp. CF514]SFR85004.1 hypothetical protein SAMN05428970_3097 [Agromyces sp. CF514]
MTAAGSGRERTRRSDPTVEQQARNFLFDAVGGFAAAGAAVLAVDAGRQSGGWTQQPDVLAPLVSGLLVVAMLAHAVAQVLGRRSGHAASGSRFILLLTGGFAIVAGAALAIRAATGQELEWLAAAVCIAAGAAVLAAVLWWRRGAVPIPRPPSAP